MKASLILGRIAGIPIGLLHYSWPILAVLILMSLTNHFAVTNPGWSVAVRWSAAAVTTLLFFVTLVIHELAHALVARARGEDLNQLPVVSAGRFTGILTRGAVIRLLQARAELNL